MKNSSFDKKYRFKESKVLEIFAQLLMAACDMKSRNAIHRDIKDKNIFICADKSIRLGDFGAAHIKEETAIGTSTMIGTSETMAPEVRFNKSGREYDTEIDIYSIGVVVFQLLYLVNYHDCLNKKLDPIEFDKRTDMSQDLYDILKLMLNKKHNRIDLQSILKYQIIQDAVNKVARKYFFEEDGKTFKKRLTYKFEKDLEDL